VAGTPSAPRGGFWGAAPSPSRRHPAAPEGNTLHMHRLLISESPLPPIPSTKPASRSPGEGWERLRGLPRARPPHQYGRAVGAASHSVPPNASQAVGRVSTGRHARWPQGRSWSGARGGPRLGALGRALPRKARGGWRGAQGPPSSSPLIAAHPETALLGPATQDPDH